MRHGVLNKVLEKEDLVKSFDFYITMPYVVHWLVIPYTCEVHNSQHRAKVLVPEPNRAGMSCLIFSCAGCDMLNVGLAYCDPTLAPMIYNKIGVPIGDIQVVDE